MGTSNTERQDMIYLHKEGEATYVLHKENGKGRIQADYQPRGNQFIYPAKWKREEAAEYFLNHLIDDSIELLKSTEDRIELLRKLKNDVAKWKGIT